MLYSGLSHKRLNPWTLPLEQLSHPRHHSIPHLPLLFNDLLHPSADPIPETLSATDHAERVSIAEEVAHDEVDPGLPLQLVVEVGRPLHGHVDEDEEDGEEDGRPEGEEALGRLAPVLLLGPRLRAARALAQPQFDLDGQDDHARDQGHQGEEPLGLAVGVRSGAEQVRRVLPEQHCEDGEVEELVAFEEEGELQGHEAPCQDDRARPDDLEDEEVVELGDERPVEDVEVAEDALGEPVEGDEEVDDPDAGDDPEHEPLREEDEVGRDRPDGQDEVEDDEAGGDVADHVVDEGEAVGRLAAHEADDDEALEHAQELQGH